MVLNNEKKEKLNIAVVCGGLGSEREISLKSGANVFTSLSKNKYNVSLIEISKDSRWLLKGDGRLSLSAGQRELTTMNKAGGLTKENLQRIDVAFLVLHGKYGEDGRVQAFLDILRIPYTGSGVLASALGMNKEKTFQLVKSYKVKTPKTIYLNKREKKLSDFLAAKIDAFLGGFPVVVKPNGSGSSVAVSLVRQPIDLDSAINKAFEEDSLILIQEYIKGREITCGAWGNSHQTRVEALPPIEIKTPGAPFFDYQAKYFSSDTKEICPAPLSLKQTEKVQGLAIKIHSLLGCDGLTRSDFIFSERDGHFYFLEINTIPGLTEMSLCPKEALASGLSFEEFLDRQIDLAREKSWSSS